MSVYFRTYPVGEKGSVIHLGGLSDYTLCGHDIAGDDLVHRKPPVELEGKHRITCEHCRDIIKVVKDYLNE